MTEVRTLVIGGSGFVGTNLANRLARAGEPVRLVDNFSRPGTRANLEWLTNEHSDLIEVLEGDVRDAPLLDRALEGVGRVFHLAAQVAVTTSVADPLQDFDINLGGTITLLEAIRRVSEPPRLLFTSTNKVYGDLEDLSVGATTGRYEPDDDPIRAHGISERRPLAFCSPYGCSKGGADQYVLDYAKSYGLDTVVFRMSCIYGPHQQGNEDQGWVAHFAKQILAGEPITLYGDGLQVRDLLYVEDLVDAMLLALPPREDGREDCSLSGRAFNIGGGAANVSSLLEMVELIGTVTGRAPLVRHDEWRVGDQRWYVSDTTRFESATGWSPSVSVRDGVAALVTWLQQDRPREPIAVAAAGGDCDRGAS